MKTSVLPNILDVAKKHGLQADPRTAGQKEVRFKCPFCLADANRPKKFFLSLNERKNVFKCWLCQESGGVLKLISFLESVHETDLIEQLRKKKGFRYQKHSVEKLTKAQLKHIGYEKVDWIKNRKYDPDLYRIFRDHVHKKWLAFVESRQESCYQQLYAGMLTGNFQQAVKRVEEAERELQVPLLEPALSQLSSGERSCEELEKEVFAADVCRQAHPFYEACDDLAAMIQSKPKRRENHESYKPDWKDDQGPGHEIHR